MLVTEPEGAQGVAALPPQDLMGTERSEEEVDRMAAEAVALMAGAQAGMRWEVAPMADPIDSILEAAQAVVRQAGTVLTAAEAEGAKIVRGRIRFLRVAMAAWKLSGRRPAMLPQQDQAGEAAVRARLLTGTLEETVAGAVYMAGAGAVREARTLAATVSVPPAPKASSSSPMGRRVNKAGDCTLLTV